MPYAVNLEEFLQSDGKGFFIGKNAEELADAAQSAGLEIFSDDFAGRKKLFFGNEVDVMLSPRMTVFHVSWMERNEKEVVFWFGSVRYENKNIRKPVQNWVRTKLGNPVWRWVGDCETFSYDSGSCLFSFSFFGEAIVSLSAHNYFLERS